MREFLVRTICLLFILMAKASLFAYEVDNIEYTLVSGTNTAYVGNNRDKGLKGEIVIPETITYEGVTYRVTGISDKAFYDNGNITSVILPSSITYIGKQAFEYCFRLASINIPNSVETIGWAAFGSCALESIILPNSLKTIDGYAFRFSHISSLTIPSSVEKIGGNIIHGCGFLNEIVVDNNNPYYDSRNNCNAIIDKGNNSLIAGIKNTTIPDGIVSIGPWAFAACGLNNVTIPNSVTAIEENAFRENRQLTQIQLPDNLITIGTSAFEECGISGTLSIPQGVTSIKGSAFKSCNKIQKLIIPNSVKEMEYYSFAYCLSLKEVKTEIMEPFEIDPGVFYSISYPAVLQVPKGLKEKYEATYAWNTCFKEIVEESLTYKLTISSIGNGYASFDGVSVRGKTSSFDVEEGTSALITFTPDDGYQIKSVKVNNSDVTSSLWDSKYTVSNINGDTTVEVEFEAIPPTIYTLSVTATGNGAATYNGTSIKDKTSSFDVEEGTSATITFTPDDGYQIKSVKVNNSDVTSSLWDSKYTVSNINGDTTVEVEFEAIPPTIYTLSVTATGKGAATYNGTSIKDKTSSFDVEEGTNVTITFTPDNGYRIKSVKVNNKDVTSSVSNSKYTISSISGDTSVEVEFEAIPPTTYTLSIKATGNGSATYDGTTIKNKTNTFTVTEGTSVTITFTPDNGYRIKSVKVNSTDVTSSVSNSKYTISSISGNTTVEVEFEAIPPTTYTLSIKATGNGSVTYDGTTVKNQTKSFTLTEGTSASITITPDDGCRIKSVKINNSDVTSSILNNSFTINNISRNTDVEVEFEVIPSTTYTLSITATGNGSATYEGTVIKGNTSSFTVNEGANATITFTPDNGYRIKSVKANNTDVTSKVANNAYTVSNINSNTTVDVEFEAIPATAYTLSIKATGNGSVTYDGTSVRGKTSSFTVNGGTSATITLSADNGNRIKSVIVNNTDVTSKVMNNSYIISNISGNTTVEVVFEEIIAELTNDGVYYSVVSETQQTVKIVSVDNGLVLDVPASFTAKDKEWKVVGVEANVLNNPELAAIIWNPEVTFTGIVNNPNLLLYVKDKKYAPDDIQNVVVNGEAEDIVLQDAEDGNNFYCPKEFTAKRISYIHRYSMKTGFKTCQGWETIVLPFDVTTILSATGTEIVPYIAWQQGSSSRPFWLYSLNDNGWKAENGIKANTPYIISMPNNDEYDATYNLSGDIQFMSSNVQVLSSEGMSASKSGNKQLVPNYQNKVASQDIYALNVNSQLNTNTATETEGSAFIRSLRQVRPFEAYMTIEGGAGARRVIPIFGDDAASIPSIPVSIDRRNDAIYNLNGQRVNTMSRGIYIQNGKKIIKK